MKSSEMHQGKISSKNVTEEKSREDLKLRLMGNLSSPAKTIRGLRKGDGSRLGVSGKPIGYWKYPRLCAWCGMKFVVKIVQASKKRFCGRSCSAKWRMSQPEIIAKVHTKEVHAIIGQKKSLWFKSGSPKAIKELNRIRHLNPMSDPFVRFKVSKILKSMSHKPSERGGNGKGLTKPQSMLLEALPNGWVSEYALSLGPRRASYSTCYKLDLANPKMKINIEVDGNSHHSRKRSDMKRDAMLDSLGWKVLRFWNKD